jgi:hypothetical protein
MYMDPVRLARGRAQARQGDRHLLDRRLSRRDPDLGRNSGRPDELAGATWGVTPQLTTILKRP